jgi:hypothetical protein
MNVTRIKAVLLVGLILLFVAVVGLSPEMVWDGRFQLDVRLQSRSAAAIKDVSYALYHDREVANRVAGTTEQSVVTEFRSVENAGSGRYLVSVPCSGRRWLGVEHGYFEYRFIVLRLRYNDKSAVCTAVEIPEGRGQRSVAVDVP